MNFDLIVLGSGPGGYVAAIRASQLGMKVAIVERENLGGICLNWGCIPTKALLKSAQVFNYINHADDYGISVSKAKPDFEKMIGRSRGVADGMSKGVTFLMKKNKITVIEGDGKLARGKKVVVTDTSGSKKEYSADNIIVATGARARSLPNIPIDGKKVIGYRKAMTLPKQPKRMVVIGAGAIGVEFAYIYNAFGTKVTIIEMQKNLLPVEDDEVGAAITKSFTRQGIKCLVDTKVTGTQDNGDSVTLTVENAKGTQEITADVCLVAIGVAPVLPGGMEPELDRGFIKVGDRYETSIPSVFACGDISGPPWLAHTASFEAIQCVEGMFVEGHTPRKVGNFPGCTYAHPQVASVGKTERALKEEGVDYKVGNFPYAAIGKAQASGDTEGFVKLLFGKEHGELLGAHIIGENATELIAEMGLALEMECTADEIHSTIHAHPTLAEAIHEATLDADGHAIHF